LCFLFPWLHCGVVRRTCRGKGDGAGRWGRSSASLHPRRRRDSWTGSLSLLFPALLSLLSRSPPQTVIPSWLRAASHRERSESSLSLACTCPPPSIHLRTCSSSLTASPKLTTQRTFGSSSPPSRRRSCRMRSRTQESYSPGLAQRRRTDSGILERARFPVALEPADAILYTRQKDGPADGRA
jgi:hypothetical protein